MSFPSLTAHFFLVLNNIPLSGCVIAYSFTYGKTVGCLQVLAIMNKAAINIPVQVFCMAVVFNSFG